MKFRISSLFILVAVLLSSATFSDDELFKNESLLDACRQDIPLTYRRKDDIKVAEAAKALQGKELILLHYDKKSKTVSYQRYYLVSEQSGRDIFNYLVRKEDYLAKRKIAIFLKFTKKYDRFYLADCFDQILAENSELKALLKEVKE